MQIFCKTQVNIIQLKTVNKVSKSGSWSVSKYVSLSESLKLIWKNTE